MAELTPTSIEVSHENNQKYVGVLSGWMLYGTVMTGILVEDARGRFPPNSRVRTSKVLTIDCDGYVHTLNSIYKLEGVNT